MAEAPPKTQIKSSSEDENGSKYFLYKATLVTLFLVIVPLFPSLAPDFFNQTLHARSWELLQLIFVGIAVSYGLFSKKNDVEPQKENAQSYVSKLLQVSSVFDDESEPENHTVIEEKKFQALNSQYYRGEPPVVVVAKENPAVAESNGVVSQLTLKPLLLPVRSLKQVDSCSNGSGTSSRKSRNGDEEKEKEKEKEEEKAVLRSPIPWRSRSGRMEVRENDGELTSVEDQEYINRIESRSFRPSRPISSPTSLSRGEDAVRKKSFVPPPPAPPPPPSPLLLRKSVLMKSSSSVGSNAGSTGKVLARSVRSVPTEESVAELRYGVENDGSVKPNEEKESMNYEMKFFNRRESNEKKKMEFDKAEKFLMDTTESEDSEAEAEAEEYDNFGGADDDNSNDVGPDVDKKADEFIAKFREQIRLQRIEDIRKSTAQRAGKASRGHLPMLKNVGKKKRIG